jgi:hypothetical protein
LVIRLLTREFLSLVAMTPPLPWGGSRQGSGGWMGIRKRTLLEVGTFGVAVIGPTA